MSKRADFHPVVFWTSTVIIFGMLAAGVWAQDVVAGFFDNVQAWIIKTLGWFYVLSMTGFVVFAVWLWRSRFGGIRLGADDVCTLCVVLFFVTSSDSASLVVDTIASGGAAHPPVWQRIYWAVMEGVVALSLLLTGGLAALQTATMTTALPFCLIIIAMCVSLVRALREDPGAIAPRRSPKP